MAVGESGDQNSRLILTGGTGGCHRGAGLCRYAIGKRKRVCLPRRAFALFQEVNLRRLGLAKCEDYDPGAAAAARSSFDVGFFRKGVPAENAGPTYYSTLRNLDAD